MGEEVNLKDEMEGKITISAKINNVPIKFWEEFKKDAEVNFANNYIMKIMVDHYRRLKGDERYEELDKRLRELEEKVSSLEKNDGGSGEEKEKSISTFG